MSTILVRGGRADGSAIPAAPLVADVVALLERACDEFERDGEAAKASISHAIRMLHSELQRREPGRGGTGELAGWQVQRLQAYVDAHLGDTIRVKDLGGVARRSTAHFCRAFKRTFGRTPHAYVTERRLEHAKRLMLRSDERLSVIAVSCGFTDQAHLSKLFRRHMGETPGAWRRRVTA